MFHSRSLTAGEIKLAQSLFGGAIDYAKVRVHDRAYMPGQAQNSGMTPRGHIYMRGSYSADYAQEQTGSRAFFLHEMAHVWQYQNKILHPVVQAAKLQVKHKFKYAASYSFSLDPKKDLTDYGMEQQAAILEEYYLLRHGLQRGQCADALPAPEKMARFEKVLARFLKNPAYARRKSFFSRRPPFSR